MCMVLCICLGVSGRVCGCVCGCAPILCAHRRTSYINTFRAVKITSMVATAIHGTACLYYVVSEVSDIQIHVGIMHTFSSTLLTNWTL